MIDESELRDELSRVHVPPPDRDLAASAIQVGRSIRRRRTRVTLLAVSLLAVGGIGIAIGALPTRNAVPADPTGTPATSITPTPSMSPGPTPTGDPTGTPAFWTSDTLLPANFGDTSTLTLPLDATQPTDDVEISPDPGHALMCRDRSLTIPALRTVVAGRNLHMRAPTSIERQAVLVFGSEADAIRFMDQARDAATACRDEGPTEASEPPLSYRSVPTFTRIDAPGEEAFAWGAHTLISSDGGATWNNATDAGIDVLARSGSMVALAGMSGEYAGDLAADPWAMAQLSGWLGLILGR